MKICWQRAFEGTLSVRSFPFDNSTTGLRSFVIILAHLFASNFGSSESKFSFVVIFSEYIKWPLHCIVSFIKSHDFKDFEKVKRMCWDFRDPSWYFQPVLSSQVCSEEEELILAHNEASAWFRSPQTIISKSTDGRQAINRRRCNCCRTRLQHTTTKLLHAQTHTNKF